MPSPTVLQVTDLTKSYAGRTVLAGIDLRAGAGHRIGLVGENGAGKSTLLRLLAGIEPPDNGSIAVPADAVYLPQEPTLDGTVAQVMAKALAPLHAATRDVEILSSSIDTDPAAAKAFAQVLEWAQAHDAWDTDRRAEIAAQRLGIAAIDRDRPVASLSGGERTRLALAAVITTRPDCVLLDEPTNHLDDGAMELLEEFLTGLPGIVIAASHDRMFLDRVCTGIVDLDPSAFGTDGLGGRRYGGGFSSYLTHKAQARRRWELTYADQQDQLAELRRRASIGTDAIAHNRGPRDNDKFIYQFKGGNVERALARRVHDAERRLEVAERTAVARPPDPLRFRTSITAVPTTHATDEMAVQIRDLEVPGRVRIARLDVPTGGRMLLTGANGSGKSSLLAVLRGRLPAPSGTVRVTARSIGLLEQDVMFDDPAASARTVFSRAVGPDGAELLGGLGLLTEREIDAAVNTLSVGQRRRLALAILVSAATELLLLDEPTNHISLALAAELEEAIGSAPGTVLVASHDRWLRRRWAGPVGEVCAA